MLQIDLVKEKYETGKKKWALLIDQCIALTTIGKRVNYPESKTRKEITMHRKKRTKLPEDTLL
jgi:hypothetical protein